MRILVVATKPPWPPRDGGRLALWLSLCGLAEAGHQIEVVAPEIACPDPVSAASQLQKPGIATYVIPARRRSWLAAALVALRDGCAISVARHQSNAVTVAIARRIAARCPDIVHVEQLQALANCAPARAAGIPIVLRMQNVESALWRQAARTKFTAPLLRIEAARMRADERRALAYATQTIALTQSDANELRDIADPNDRDRIAAIAPAFPVAIPAGERVEGSPAIVVAGSSGWWPNMQGVCWFVRDVWPHLASVLPNACLHVFGGEAVGASPAIIRLDPPEDSRDSFPEGAIAVVPLLAGSGIRMRILEAWARGLPVVATPQAAHGLEITQGRELLLAETPDQMLTAIRLLSEDQAMRDSCIAAGRAYLAARHNSHRATASLVEVYCKAMRP
ncbi:MAG: glycosyltransferase [Dokdonella sp.]